LVLRWIRPLGRGEDLFRLLAISNPVLVRWLIVNGDDTADAGSRIAPIAYFP
jgi:hypothetical protein